MEHERGVPVYTASYEIDREPLPELPPITATSLPYISTNKVWVAGGQCYILTGSEYAHFLDLVKQNPRGIAVNQRPVIQHQPAQ